VSETTTVERWECSNEEYHASEGISNSKLSDFIKDPAYYHAKHVAKTYSDPPKDCYKFGTIVHERVLLDNYAGEILLVPENVLNKDGHRKGKAWLEFAEDNSDKYLLTQAELDRVNRYCDAVHANPTARQIVEDSEREVSLRWTDDETGLPCRCRVDALHPMIDADLKTTRDNTPAGFAAAAFRYGYHRQKNWYQEGTVRHRQGQQVPFLFIAVTEWSCNVFELDEQFDAFAQAEIRKALQGIKDCTESGDWTNGLGRDVISLKPPRWAYTQQQYEVEEEDNE
jgi:hypothetical protein